VTPEVFDDDGYPTKQTLRRIARWDIHDIPGWFEFVQSAWNWGPRMYSKSRRGIYRFHTGGWSGNEDIIDAMMKNRILWMFTWRQSRAGGHYQFRDRTAKGKKP